MGCALYVRCALSVLQKECRKVWGARYTLGARYQSENTVIVIVRKGRIRNTIIKPTLNVTRSLLDDIKTKQLQWYGHVSRMEEGRLPKEVMKWRPPGRGKRGRPKRTWTDGIRGLMGGERD